MTRTEVIAIARDVGMCGMLTDVVCTIDELERFAALVAAKEREAWRNALQPVFQTRMGAEQFQCDKLNEHHGAIGKEARLPLYTVPQPSPASQGDALDAARYRYLRDGDWREHEKLESVIRLQLNTLWDETIDAARAAQEGKNHD